LAAAAAAVRRHLMKVVLKMGMVMLMGKSLIRKNAFNDD
jgi:hypothetical protein